MNNSLDYTKDGYILPLERGSIKTYASINNQKEWDESERVLIPTGRYFVYLLHPTKSGCCFNMDFEEESNEWNSSDAPGWVEADIITEISKSIQEKEKQ